MNVWISKLTWGLRTFISHKFLADANAALQGTSVATMRG